MIPVLLAALLVQSPPPVATFPFHGRVVRAEDGAPIAGARAELRWNRSAVHRSRSHGEPRTETVAPPPFPSVESGADGRFRIDVDPTNAPWIVVAAEGRGAGACGRLAGHADAATAVDVRLSTAARLELHLGLEIGGAGPVVARVASPLYVASFPAWLGVLDDWRRDYERDAIGADPFVLDGLPPGTPLEIEILRGGVSLGRVEPDVVLAAGATGRSGWTPHRGPGGRGGVDVSVRVRDAQGAPIAGATVLLERASGFARAISDPERAETRLTDADGEARFERVTGARCVVDVGGDLDAPPAYFEPGSGASIEFRAAPGRTARGRVVDPAGAPVAGARVWFAPSGDRDAWTAGARTGANGAFELRGLPRLATGVLRVVHPLDDELEIVHTETTLDPETPRDLVFPATSPVRARAVDASGATEPAAIRHGPRAILGIGWREFLRGEDEFDAPVGPCLVSAYAPDGRAAFALTTVRAGAANVVDLRLAPGGSVRFRHRGGAELVDVELATADGRPLGVTTVRRGVDVVELAPAGDWTVRVAGVPARTIRVEAGIETLLEL